MRRKYCFCILCIALFVFTGCAKTKEGQKENGNDVVSGNSETELLTEEEAKEKALAHAGFESSQVTFVHCKLEHEDGRQVYDVEFYAGDNQEFDYKINAYTGGVISYDYDAEYSMPQEASGEGNEITEEAAKKLALDRVPGASDGDIREFKTDREDGRVEYEGKIIYDGMEYEFEIGADSGAFIDWEQEPVGH